MKSNISNGRLALSLALIAMLGPAGIDMYLPSMPDMARELGTSYAQVQLTLTVFLLAMGLGQLVFGPLIDAYGRRRFLLAGIAFFSIGAIWASNANSIEMLLVARFVQGLASSLTLVAAISTVRDMAEGVQAARLFALLMTIQGLAPVMSPAIGGYVELHFGWRAVFITLASMGGLVLINTFLQLAETLPPEKRISARPIDIMRTYARIAANRHFLLPALALSTAFFFLFIYIGGAAFVYQTLYGLSPAQSGLVFGSTGVAVMLGALACGRWVIHTNVATLAMRGAIAMCAGGIIATIAVTTSIGLPGVAIGMFVAMFGLGIAESALMSMAMSSQQNALGSTAALLGGMQLTISSTATPLAGMLVESGALQWAGMLALTGIPVLLLVIASSRHQANLTSEQACG